MRENKELFQPIKIGGIQVKNRIVMPAMDTNFANADGSMSTKLQEYLLERARGGTGLIITEAVSVAYPQGIISANQPRMDDVSVVPKWWNLVRSVHGFGSRILIQLHHAGLQGNQAFCKGKENISSSDMEMFGKSARAASAEEIGEVIQKFINAAKIARATGADGIEIHGAHMYLINQFLSPLINRRTDEYGGSTENRGRILREIIEGIRKACPRPFIISVRLPGQDFIPGGITLEEGIHFAKIAQDAGADMLNMTNGYIMEGSQQFETQWDKEGQRIFLGETVKKHVSIPVAVVGKLQTPSFCAKAIREGKTDMVCLGRQLICDPAWGNKALFGKDEEIRTCLSCNSGCMQGEDTANALNPAVQCVLNPYAGYEDIYRESFPQPAAVSKKIVVVGGGVAGMQLAITASARGHKVELYEKSDKLGGQLVLAAIPPHKESLEKARQWFISEVERRRVTVSLNAPVDEEQLLQKDADVYVLAIGSEQNVPPIKGIEYALPTWDILTGKVAVAEHASVAIIGGGQVSCETAHWLIEKGCQVTIIEMLPQICKGQEVISRMKMTGYLSEHARIETEAKTTSIERSGLHFINQKGESVYLPADLVLYSTGQHPVDDKLYSSLLEAGKEVYKIGDFNLTGDIRTATRSAVELAYSL